MFTGIVRHVGAVRRVESTGGGKALTIDLGPLAQGLSLGDSVAVSGVCLTAASIQGTTARFDVVAETLSRSTLGALGAGAKVNLERALTLSQGLDGHLVQGHIDGQARVKAVRTSGGAECAIEFTAASELADLMVPKGSVAIDGVSLTLVSAQRSGFSVALIPTTLSETTLGGLSPGSAVNVEADIIGKYVRKYLGQFASSGGSGLTMEKLRDAGFL